MILIYGYSDLAKTAIANQLAKAFDFKVVSASTPIREFARNNSMPNASREYLTTHTKYLLRNNRFWSAEELAKLVTSNTVLEGVRNPLDFVKLFDPATDLAIKVSHPQEQAINNFEYYGCAAIAATIEFYISNNLLASNKHISVIPDLDPDMARPPLSEEEVKYILNLYNGKCN